MKLGPEESEVRSQKSEGIDGLAGIQTDDSRLSDLEHPGNFANNELEPVD